ncbi:hypothetical protein [Candidatus Odyssella acanthamoebae]|uniref:Uncharacterized protein n=1 Tax=Candidatus Odyssella acanthamoebae TaxID=91604 RepID=A0A077B1M8_9PROT|nr:hypothetical protein [Candidatus Paracaedibacter acanthamoebae]AIK96840.1 hypothetical protein ID47_09005 [Candidatus Paracaedibacter acanthamoebae]
MKFSLYLQTLFFIIFAAIPMVKAKEISWELPAIPSTYSVAGEAPLHQRLAVCSDDRYAQKMKEVGVNEEEILSLPKPTYVLLREADLHAFMETFSTCTVVSQGIAKINKGANIKDYFLIHSLFDCVGITIYTPTATYASHIDIVNIDKGKLNRLLDRVPANFRQSAQVTLVSSHYSIVLKNVWESLKNKGFQTIQADIESCVFIHREGYQNTYKYIKASSFGKKVKDFKGVSLDKIDALDNLSAVVAPRSLIINAKTGILYTVVGHEERHQETSILFKLESVGAFGAKK